jgi:hypothetical protein
LRSSLWLWGTKRTSELLIAKKIAMMVEMQIGVKDSY